MSILSRKKKFHFVGIGGAGMSGLAELLLQLGHSVSGSDRQESEVTDYLAQKGAIIYQGHETRHVDQVDYLIYSSAISSRNPELEEAQRRKIPVIRRAEMLGQLMNRKFGIAVAGTHGKTTTTAMIGHILIEVGLDPTLVVGGRLRNLMTNARLGSSAYLVAEADEYDRSFLTLFPRIAVLTSLEADHLDIYQDLNDLKQTFTQFARQVTFDGILVICADDANLKAIQSDFITPVITYGVKESADFRADNIHYDQNRTAFSLLKNQQSVGDFRLIIPGEHNVKNALAAIVVCSELEIPYSKISQALSSFSGVERRFEVKGIVNDIMIIDDYAHHPSEILATLQGARKGWQRRIVAVFQPHLYSRTKDFYKEFAQVLSVADVAIITDVYPAREEKIAGVSGNLIVRELQQLNHPETVYVENKNDLAQILIPQLKPNDMLITMGAGDIWQAADEVMKRLKEK